MKNKKIILGLGTITALGAMSVGFIACVKEEKVKEIVNGAGYSKLTKEQVKELLANLSTLTKEQVKELLANLSTLTKEDVKSLINEGILDEPRLTNIFSKELSNYFGSEDDSGKVHKNNNIGHFASGSKVKDVIDAINTAIQDKGWTVVEDPQRDNIVGKNTKELIETNGQVLRDGDQEIKFKLKKTLGSLEIETEHEINFNFFVGQKDLSTITDKNLHHSAITKEKIVEELNKKEEFKNVNLTKEDFEIVQNSKQDPTKTKTGKIKIKAKTESEKIKGEVELTLETVKAPLNKTHIGDLKLTNKTTKKEIFDQINKHTDFNGGDKKIAESDFDFAKDDATLNHIGKIKITPKGKTEGELFTIDIPRLIDLKSVITNTELGEIDTKDEASIKKALKGKFSIIDDNDITITIDQSKNEATITGKDKYAGSVKVIFTIKKGNQP